MIDPIARARRALPTGISRSIPAPMLRWRWGMMHIIVRDGLHDGDYIAALRRGLRRAAEAAARYTPEQVAHWTGFPQTDIERLAHEYATTRPAVIRLNYGVQRTQNGGAAVRAVCMLPVITGSWKEVGGGLQLSTSGGFAVESHGSWSVTDLMQKSPLGRAARTINMVELGKALTEVNDPPVKALFVYNSNPAAVCPDTTSGGAGPEARRPVHRGARAVPHRHH